ncbi:cupin domain-containing protein [Cupriavidus pauculus]|uniref:cupin domain-containing protein n=1 Tax=Cupriavidus pauculus TaxID=82633 RepID=UPI001EE2D725|nr:cupin domain-containing protein [Cupriavidus pauculus]GJG97897.1 cupin domain-containing protein [Cupriavidus pauculus]
MPATPQQRLIDELGLIPHPEGGFYRETFRDAAVVTRASDGAQRSASTAIYYLLCDDAYSAWHRIQADEAWHFHAGDPIHVHWLTPDGTLATHRLGNPLLQPGTVFQAAVPAGCWFAAERVPSAGAEEGFALAGCTVAPGFEFSEFELADAAALAAAHPAHADLLKRLASR